MKERSWAVVGGWVAAGAEEGCGGWVLAAAEAEDDEAARERAEVRGESMADEFSFGFPGGLARFYRRAI